ncbi:hypothetical protein T03_18136 [Trichinella britovi]|uniref:Uncharacterized protein n=1 Tax=Trichinella britovi TaxID=45882 RepID=A0A0V1BA34_TRIBR|nr:hypothetical protein T03_18136 [Trichinella britovi]
MGAFVCLTDVAIEFHCKTVLFDFILRLGMASSLERFKIN